MLWLDSFVDVVFFVDLFDGVNFISYNKEKVFVKFMVKCLNIFLDKFWVVVVVYGLNLWLEIGLDDNNDFFFFNSIMDSMVFLGGFCRIDKVLEIVVNVLNELCILCLKIVVLLMFGW